MSREKRKKKTNHPNNQMTNKQTKPANHKTKHRVTLSYYNAVKNLLLHVFTAIRDLLVFMIESLQGREPVKNVLGDISALTSLQLLEVLEAVGKPIMGWMREDLRELHCAPAHLCSCLAHTIVQHVLKKD